MKTSVSNFIASLFIGATAINANAETITTGSVMNTNNQEVITYAVHHPSCANTSNGSIDIDVINGAVKRGVGVDVTAVLLDGDGDLAAGAALGALEKEVF